MREPRQIVETILAGRGLTDPEDIAEYFSDSPRRTYDPFDLMNMREGVDLILETIEKGGRICIYGDYDADGVTSICILHQGLSNLTDDLTWYIPSRFDEGYGVNMKAIEKLAADGVDLIITVDCGISSVEEVAKAKELGMEVLVTDHHKPADELPDCLIIDPKQEGETYPNENLAGCGVAFKILQGIQRAAELPKTVVNDALDLVGMGTVGDIVSLTDENRTIVKYGLVRLNEGTRPSIKALADAISIDEITSENISFGIVPHINAAGRMSNAGEAVKLFLSEDPTVINAQVDKLIACNSERRRVQDRAYESCKNEVAGDEDIIFLKVPGVHEGIAGIAAGKLKETFSRPVVLTTPVGDGTLKGTCRSIDGLDIHSLLSGHKDVFMKFGGHKSACGFTMMEEDFEGLKEAVTEDVKAIYASDPSLLEGGMDHDIELELSEINMALAEEIDRMEPFGEGNPAPVFLVRGARVMYHRYMGAEGQHLRFTAVKEDAGIQCVLFRRADEFAPLIEGDGPIDMTGRIKSQVWNGEKRLQFIVEEIRSGR